LLRSIFACVCAAVVAAPPSAGSVQFVFTSDAHYGITRASFRGGRNVDARTVNRALVASINQLPSMRFPSDGGVGAGAPVGAVDFLVEGGDVSNREDVADGKAIEKSELTWREFCDDYRELTLTDRTGSPTPLFVVPGNHESSNAVGFYKAMDPPTDPSALIAEYNLTVKPAVPLTAATFAYDRDRIHASRDIGGVHFVFLHVWPDSSGRAWMEEDLAHVPRTTPVVIFTHDPPEADPRHFINPNGAHDVNAADKFENLLSDRLADGAATDAGTLAEQSALEAFVVAHPNITAYFHGHSNSNQFYDWTGPHHAIALHAFRVDSPMKGAVSKDDETKLSFQIATIDMTSRAMTVREVLWNEHPVRPALTWGASTTVVIGRREKT
jgi:Calcineurin-like phosphoesterase